MKTKIFFILTICCLLPTACTRRENKDYIATGKEIEQYLHVPSPEWEDQIIYFIVTDRFMDGDTTNNDQGEGEYRQGNGTYWQGGDLKGLIEKIDYIKELGATGIWITPPVANQAVNPQRTGTGNHGYWARSFVEVDRHLGTLEDYRQLSATLHKNGMYLIQDVVVNHLGDFYTYTGPYNPDDVTENFMVHDVPQPTQYPFMHNDANNPADLEMAIFHFTPNFQDHSDTVKKRMYQFADLDDLNTENPVVRKVLRESYDYWIKVAGVDGYRFDTPHMVDHIFWNDFLHSDDTEAPGIQKFAAKMDKKHFLTFGEAAYPAFPLDDHWDKEAARYLGTPGKPEMESILNFPLVNTIGRVFKEQRPTHLMTYRLESIKRHFPHPEWLCNFIDNHDGARFLTQASHATFRQAMLFIMTIPGIPVIYYGTEQELPGTRQSMFKGGNGSPDHDQFITDNESFGFIQELTDLRKNNDALRRGEPEVLMDDRNGPGIFIYKLAHEDGPVFVMLNTSETEKWAGRIPTGLEEEVTLNSFYSLSGKEMELTVDNTGNVSTLLEPKEGIIFTIGQEKHPLPAVTGDILIDPVSDKLISTDKITVSGTVNGFRNAGLIIDGDITGMIEVTPDESGQWSAVLPLGNLVNGPHRITAFGLVEGEFQVPSVSDFLDFELGLPAVLCGEYRDVPGDDNGPGGTYSYPAHPSYHRQMDIESVNVYRIGNNLRVDVTMGEVTRFWLPPNNFDHVLINIFIDLPGKEGITALPFQNAEMPAGSAWDYTVSAAGFGNAIFSSEGASATGAGRATGPAAMISSDQETGTISFTVSAGALGNPSDVSGSRIYITTWEGGPGQPRDLVPAPGDWTPSGGTKDQPRIMDDTELIILE